MALFGDNRAIGNRVGFHGRHLNVAFVFDPSQKKDGEQEFETRVVASERIAPIVIPPAAADAQKLDPQPRCLDYPPPFFGSKRPPSSQPAAPSAAGEAAATPATAPPSAQAPAPSTEQSTGKP